MIDMETIADRVKQEREAKGWDQPRLAAEASRRAGKPISKQIISNIELGKTYNPSYNTLSGISDALDVTQTWLLTGKPPKERGTLSGVVQGVRDTYPIHYVSQNEIAPGYVRLPLLNMEGSMGHGSYSDDALEVVEHLDVAEWWARKMLPKQLDRVRIISARGDSMAGLINHGDIVFVDESINYFDGEGIYVFNWQGHALIKRLAPNLLNRKLQILSTNGVAYPPEEISVDEIDQLHIAGRVAAWWTLRHY